MLLHSEEMKAEILRRLRYHREAFGVSLDLMADDVAITTKMDAGRLNLCIEFDGGPSWAIPFDKKAESAIRAAQQRAAK